MQDGIAVYTDHSQFARLVFRSTCIALHLSEADDWKSKDISQLAHLMTYQLYYGIYGRMQLSSYFLRK